VFSLWVDRASYRVSHVLLREYSPLVREISEVLSAFKEQSFLMQNI